MKALTLTQPWASAIMLGYKRVETRSWRTHYRGIIAIHAAQGYPREAREFAMVEHACGRFPDGRLALGAVLGTAQLVDCQRTELAALVISADDPKRWGLEHRYGDYGPGRWAWLLDDIRPFPEPIQATGSLGLWEWHPQAAVLGGTDR